MTFDELEYKYSKALDDLISLQQDYLNLRRKHELVNLEKTRLEREVSDLKNIAKERIDKKEGEEKWID